MKSRRCWGLLTAFFLSDLALAQLPSWDAEQTAVWQLVEKSWVDQVAENDRWPRDYVHQKVVDWSDRQPAPVEIDKLVEWWRFSAINEDQKGDRERSVLNLIEVLIRQGGDWKYLSLSNFEPKNE